MIYLIVVFLLLALVYFYDIIGFQKNKIFWYRAILVIFILLAGLRYRLGIDTPRYIYDYFYDTPLLHELGNEELNIGNYPLWNVLNSFFLTIGTKFYVVQLVEASFVNILIFKYIKKHSQYIFTCVFFFFIWMYASYCMEAMKAGFSMALCLFAHDYFLEKKWVKGSLLFFVAFLFHMSSLIVAAVAVLRFLRLDFKGVCLLALTFLLGSVFISAYGDLITLFSFNDQIMEKAEAYGESDVFFAVEGKNYNYYIANYFTVLISSLIAFRIVKSHHDALLRHEPYLFLGLFFLTLSTNIYIFFRIYYFYVIYVILFITQALMDLIKSYKETNCFYLAHFSAVLFPFLFYIYFSYYGVRWMRYYPYSSIITKEVDKERERMYNSIRFDYCQAREDEY